MPHVPYTPPDSLRDKYRPLALTPVIANYWAMCEWFDITCGELVDFIEQRGLSKNTLFIYVTDNGYEQDPEKESLWTPRSLLSPYELGIRTPILFRWKGVIEPEMDRSSLASIIDVPSTVFGVCGIQATPEMQGIYLLNEEARKERDAVFAENYDVNFLPSTSASITGSWLQYSGI